VKRIVHFDLAAVVLANEKSGQIDVGFLSDPDRTFYRKGDSIVLAGTVFSGLLEERNTVIVDDLSLSNDLGAQANKERDEFRSMMKTPLSSEETVFGGLILFSRQKNSFTERERTIVERLSAQITSTARKYMASRREEQLLIALDSIGEAVAFLDSDSVYQRVNRAFEDLYGYSEDEIRGRPVSVIPVRDTKAGPQTREVIEQELSSDWSGEVVRIAKSGELLDILLTVTPVKDDNGEVIGRISISRNITERKRTEARLNETSRLASMGELAAGVAHEINNPLTNIMLCSEYLADSDLPEEALADLRTITDSALRAAKIVQNLLLFARHKGWDPAPLPMTTVLDRALELKSYDFKIKSIKVRLDIAHEIPRSLIDEHQMTQVIVNILNNAEQVLTAHRSGGVIRIKMSVADGQVLTAITDDGPGIPAEILPKIFDPFFTTKPAGEGTGLGLSICFGIVQQHGGEMWAESALQRNTTIYIRIPVAERAEADLPLDELPEMDLESIERLLVVDDESSIREMVSKGLNKEFDYIDLAESGEEALEKVRAEDYSCILLDLRLNGIGGPEVYRQIADYDQEKARKIIFITGDTASPATRSFLASVGNAVIPKPFTIRQVRESISAVR
jgi:two-component system NtrC family sensor kinase